MTDAEVKKAIPGDWVWWEDDGRQRNGRILVITEYQFAVVDSYSGLVYWRSHGVVQH